MWRSAKFTGRPLCVFRRRAKYRGSCESGYQQPRAGTNDRDRSHDIFILGRDRRPRRGYHPPRLAGHGGRQNGIYSLPALLTKSSPSGDGGRTCSLGQMTCGLKHSMAIAHATVVTTTQDRCGRLVSFHEDNWVGQMLNALPLRLSQNTAWELPGRHTMETASGWHPNGRKSEKANLATRLSGRVGSVLLT